MARKKPRSSVGVRILMGVARVLAAAAIAVAASAALADLDLRPVEFSRILPVVLTGEGIIYILMLGGGTVAAPILLLSVLLGLIVRAGIAVAAGALSPQVSGNLIASAEFYYASYWPAAAAQIVMMAVALRLIRPLIATRKRRVRRGRPEVAEALQDSRADEERHDALLVTLAEDTDEPPVSPTVLEERQIGDLTEAAEREPDEEEAEEPPALPFEEEAEEPEPEPEQEEPEEEAPLPPGVIDATPEAVAAAAEDAGEIEREEAGGPEATGQPEPDVSAEEEPEETPAAADETAETPSGVSPGEDTAPLSPVRAPGALERAEVSPPENLQGMIDVISDAAGEGTDVRVWRTSDGRTVLAAVPSGTPAAGTGGHADALVSAHLEVCAWLGAEATNQQLAATSIGAWSLQALDPDGATMLVMAARGEAAAGRIQLAGERAARAVRGLAEEANAAATLEEPGDAASALPLIPETSLAEAISGAATGIGGRFAGVWQAWRGPHRRIIAVRATPGADAETAGRKTARLVAPAERFADAVALDGLDWLAIASDETLLALHWAQRDGEPMVLSATAGGGAALGRVRWELGEIARLIDEQ